MLCHVDTSADDFKRSAWFDNDYRWSGFFVVSFGK
jgi:hypothetical protein